MTLPASGTITMGMVKTELGLSGTLTLTDSRVRALFGKPSGTIKLTDGYGKSNFSRIFGAYVTFNPSVTNYTNAFDTETSPGQVPTTSGNSSSWTTKALLGTDTYYTLSLSGVSGKYIKIILDATCNTDTYSRNAGSCYSDCGSGPLIHFNGDSVSAIGTVQIHSSPDNAIWTLQADLSTGNNQLVSFYTILSTIYIRVTTATVTDGPLELDPCCPGTTVDAVGTASAAIACVCAETS